MERTNESHVINKNALTLLVEEHNCLRREILQRLSGVADIEKVSLTATSVVYAFLLGANNANFHFAFVELLLWWVPFIVLVFSWSKIGHHEMRLKQISDYLHRIELQLYGETGFALNGATVSGWETELRKRSGSDDFVMRWLETQFWRVMIVITFGIAFLKSLLIFGIVKWEIRYLQFPDLTPYFPLQ